MTAVEKLVSKLFNPEVPLDEDIYNAIEQAKEMEREALEIIKKFVNEFDEEDEDDWVDEEEDEEE
jgi:CDP-glycerol glycerophosphotransferase (TagB/SpsB family)